MHRHPFSRLTDSWVTRASRRRVLGALGGGTGLLILNHLPRTDLAQAPAGATPAVSAAPIPLGEAVASLAPRVVWEHFFQLTQIPRPSHHEEQVSAFLANFGRDRGWATDVDEVGNVIIRTPASPGMEDRPGVILQAHMDMVPAKNANTDHDFETDAIAAVVDNGWVRAKGTTLGADDGIGVALIMALLEDEDLPRGPLEALFTVNEEDGFTGAETLQPGNLRGSILINVDSGDEGAFTIGSAGGVVVDATATYPEEPTPAGLVGMQLDVTGLRGGHSGDDINRGRGNAIKLLARLLWNTPPAVGLRVASIAGGDRHNAIPREAASVVAVPTTEAASLNAYVHAFAATVKRELAATEPDLEITAAPGTLPDTVLTAEAQRRIIGALYGSPNGVIRMNDRVPGLVETSTNLGTVNAADGRMTGGFFVRSDVDSERDDVQQMIGSVFTLAGITTTPHDAFSGWTPNPDSPLLRLMQTVFRELFGREAEVEAVHAGLEMSVIGVTYPALDMISVGPTIENAHSPDERLEIASVGKVYDLLVTTLARIAVDANPST